MSTTRPPVGPGPNQPGAPDLTNWALAALAGLFGCGALAWAGAWLACRLTGRPAPDGGLLNALAGLARPANPSAAWPSPQHMPGPVAYWSATALVAVLVGVAAWAAVRGWRRLAGAGGNRAEWLRSLPGLAPSGEVLKVAGRRALRARAAVVRPSLDRTAPPEQVGLRLGSLRGRELWSTVEDSVLLVGPTRAGKGVHLVIPWVLDAPGPVVATSTRPDTLAVTLRHRRMRGPVAIFDPQRLAGLPGGLAWSPVRGCETPRTALVRARGLAAGAGFGRTVSDADFWAGQTETALRCLLHAAALDGRRALDLYRWSLNPATAEDAVSILNRTSSADGWADALDAAIHSDPRTRDSIWLGVRQSLAALADPDVLAAVDPRPGAEFDPVEFLHSSGTLFLLASSVASGSSASLIAAFVEDITETARTLAARAPGARLDPPLLLALDELANLSPLPSLPSLMAEGGGSGVVTLAVLQSLAQARGRWGEHAADAIWDAATVKLILGGLAKYRDLDDVARLLGEVDEYVQTRTTGRGGDRSSSTSVRTVPVMPASVLRTLPVGTGVLLLRQTRPAVIDLRPWTARRDAAALRADRAAVEHATATGTEVPA